MSAMLSLSSFVSYNQGELNADAHADADNYTCDDEADYDTDIDADEHCVLSTTTY